MRISDWSSDVCYSDLFGHSDRRIAAEGRQRGPKRKAHAQPADQHLRLRARQNFSAGQCSQRFFRAAETTVHQLVRSEEHTSELQSLMRSSYAVFCLNKTTPQLQRPHTITTCTI